MRCSSLLLNIKRSARAHSPVSQHFFARMIRNGKLRTPTRCLQTSPSLPTPGICAARAYQPASCEKKRPSLRRVENSATVRRDARAACRSIECFHMTSVRHLVVICQREETFQILCTTDLTCDVNLRSDRLLHAPYCS